MKRILLAVICMTMVELAACGGSSSSNKPKPTPTPTATATPTATPTPTGAQRSGASTAFRGAGVL